MPYATQQDLIDAYGERRLIQLTDRATPPTGAIVAAVIDRALADTDALIDGYLADRYVLPIAVAQPLLKALAEPIALYKLHVKVAEEKVRADYEDALKQLKQISDGTLRLQAAGVAPQAASGGMVETNEQPRPLSAGTLQGFI